MLQSVFLLCNLGELCLYLRHADGVLCIAISRAESVKSSAIDKAFLMLHC